MGPGSGPLGPGIKSALGRPEPIAQSLRQPAHGPVRVLLNHGSPLCPVLKYAPSRAISPPAPRHRGPPCRPHPVRQTSPDPPRAIPPREDEFGLRRRSLGAFRAVRAESQVGVATCTRRKDAAIPNNHAREKTAVSSSTFQVPMASAYEISNLQSCSAMTKGPLHS